MIRYTKVVKTEPFDHVEGFGLMWKCTLACGHVLYRRRRHTGETDEKDLPPPKKLHCNQCKKDV